MWLDAYLGRELAAVVVLREKKVVGVRVLAARIWLPRIPKLRGGETCEMPVGRSR
jgi:hypothetical protein